MDKEVIIRDKRMANTIRWVCGEHYEERLLSNGLEVYVFKNKNKVLTVLGELRDLRIKYGVIQRYK